VVIVSAQITVAIITASGSIAVAAIVFFLTKSKERADQLRQRKQAHYQELLMGISDLADHTVPLQQARKRFAAAVNTVVLVAPQPVVAATMAYYWVLCGEVIDRKRSVEVLKELVLELRRSLELPFADNPATFDFELAVVIRAIDAPKPAPTRDRTETGYTR
jgi:hypothetical protein